jgi:hypothetical protein
MNGKTLIKLKSAYDLVGMRDTHGGDALIKWTLVPALDRPNESHDLTGCPPRITGSLKLNDAALESLRGMPKFIEAGYLGLIGLKLDSLEHMATKIDDMIWINECYRLRRLDLPDQLISSYANSSSVTVRCCEGLTALGNMPKNLSSLVIDSCPKLKTIGLANRLTTLEYLELRCSRSATLDSLEGLPDQIERIGRIGFSYISVGEGANDDAELSALPAGLLNLMRIDIVGSIEFSTSFSRNKISIARNAFVSGVLSKWKNQGRRGILGAQRDLLDCKEFDFSAQATL